MRSLYGDDLGERGEEVEGCGVALGEHREFFSVVLLRHDRVRNEVGEWRSEVGEGGVRKCRFPTLYWAENCDSHIPAGWACSSYGNRHTPPLTLSAR